MTAAPSKVWAAMALAVLVAARSPAALARGSHTPHAGQGRLRRDTLSAHFSRSDVIENLVVLDVSRNDPDDAPAWTGLAADGSEIVAMPARLRVSFELHGERQQLDVARTEAFVSPSYREVVLEIPHGTDALPANLTEALRSPEVDGTGRAPPDRHRRAGPRRRRTALDCVYHGTTSSGSFVSLSACELPLKVHATIHAADHGESFEVQPLDDGGHVAFYIADLADNATHTCGNSPPSSGQHAGAHDSDHEEGTAPQPPHAAEAEAGPRRAFDELSARSRRQCTKTVEVLVVNDFALYTHNGPNTETFSLAVFNAMAAMYLNGGFTCAIQLRLIGQITFRHGNPAEVVQNACNQRWHYASLPLCSSVYICNLPSGTDETCLSQQSGCGSNTLNGCYAFGYSWSTCGNRRRTTITQQAYTGGSCALYSSSADEIDDSAFLYTFKAWAETHKAALETIFNNNLDNAVALSGNDFTGSTVGKAGVGSMCQSATAPAVSVSQATSPSAFRVALISSHEMGHNFGLQHVGASGKIMSASSSGSDTGVWAWSSVTALNNAVGLQTCLDDAYVTRTGPFCGDGIVEGAEECDPGLDAADVCCTSECTFASGCVCAITDPCCNDAGTGFKSAGTVCRAASETTCDIQEVCTGSSGSCPPDALADAGVSCSSWPTGGMCYSGRCHAPLGCSWAQSYPYFFEARRDECAEICANVDLVANPNSGYSWQSSGVYAPNGTPCGDGMQCIAAGAGNGEACVTSASLNVGNPTNPPTAPPTPPPTAPPTPPPTGPPTLPPTNPPVGPPTRLDYCPEGYGDYGVRWNYGLGRVILVSSHDACAARCTQYSAPQFTGGCKAYMTGMYFGMLYCRSYGGNFRTVNCAPWAVPTDPGLNSGELGSFNERTGRTNLGGNCCSNTTFVEQAVNG